MTDKPKRCSRCGSKNLYYDPHAGPIVGGLIMHRAGKDGIVRSTRGAHHVGDWVCLDCNKEHPMNSINEIMKDLKKRKK